MAVLAADPDTGIITYGDTSVRHANKNKVVLEFVDFYQTHHTHTLNYLIFDSKFTTKEQLKRLDELPNRGFYRIGEIFNVKVEIVSNEGSRS